jgi:hypothetical protein
MKGRGATEEMAQDSRVMSFFLLSFAFEIALHLPASFKRFVEIGARARPLLLEGRNLNTGYGRTEGSKVFFLHSLYGEVLPKHLSSCVLSAKRSGLADAV